MWLVLNVLQKHVLMLQPNSSAQTFLNGEVQKEDFVNGTMDAKRLQM